MDTDRMTTKEVAEYLGRSEKTVRKMAKAGKIPFTMVGSMFSFNREEIMASLKGEVPDKAPAPAVEKAPETSNGISKSKLAEINSKISLIEAESKLAKLEGSFFGPKEREKALAEIADREAEVMAKDTEMLSDIIGREARVEAMEIAVEEREAAVLLAEQEIERHKQESLKEIKARDNEFKEKWDGAEDIEIAKINLDRRELAFDARITEDEDRMAARETEVDNRQLKADTMIRLINYAVKEQWYGADGLGERINELFRSNGV